MFGDGLAGIQHKGALVGFRRLRAIAAAFIGQTKPGPGDGALVVDVESGVEILDRLVVFAEIDEAFATRLIGRRRERISVDGVVEIRDGANIVAAFLMNESRARGRLARFPG